MFVKIKGSDREESSSSSDKDGGAERHEINIVEQESLQNSTEQEKNKVATIS